MQFQRQKYHWFQLCTFLERDFILGTNTSCFSREASLWPHWAAPLMSHFGLQSSSLRPLVRHNTCPEPARTGFALRCPVYHSAETDTEEMNTAGKTSHPDMAYGQMSWVCMTKDWSSLTLATPVFISGQLQSWYHNCPSFFFFFFFYSKWLALAVTYIGISFQTQEKHRGGVCTEILQLLSSNCSKRMYFSPLNYNAFYHIL